MGANAIGTIAIGLVMMICSFYLTPDAPKMLANVLNKVGISDVYVENILSYLRLSDSTVVPESESKGNLNIKLFTSEELAKYDGSPNSDGLYLALLGEVFNVEKGAQHYKPGGGYAFFSGKDATRAYVSGDFSEAGLVDDVSGLDGATLKGLDDWLSFYREEYVPVGKVIGRYYDKNGEPTKELKAVREKIEKSNKNKWLEDKEKELFPPCNSEWSKSKGSKVWCSDKSGGIDRNWVGVPRLMHKKGKDPRCVCVKNSGPPSAHPDQKEHNDRGDLDHPDIKEYPNCEATSESCKVDHP